VTAAFFLWTSRNGHEIDTEKWAERLRIDPADKYRILAIATFLGNVRGPVTSAVRSLIALGFAILGLEYSATAIIELANSRGVPWYFARSVVLADPSEWQSIWLTVARLTADGTVFERDFTILYPSALLIALADILLEPPQAALYQLDEIPAAIAYPRVQSFHRVPPVPGGIEISDAVLDRIISFLTPLIPIPLEWLHFFSAIKLDGRRLESVQKLFSISSRPKHDLIFLPTLFNVGARQTVVAADGSMDRDVRIFFRKRPPSLTRCFIRSLSSSILPAGMRQFAQNVIPLLTPVFPALAYANTAFYGVTSAPRALSFTQFQCGRFNADIGTALMRILSSKSIEAIWVAEGLMTLSDVHLQQVMPWVSLDVAKETLLSTVIRAAVVAESNILFAALVIDTVVALASPERLMTLICNRDFVNEASFPCVFTIFKRFQQHMAVNGKNEIVAYSKVFQDPEQGMFNQPEKAKVFRDFSDPENIAAALHSDWTKA
jgi:hypothetical protein